MKQFLIQHYLENNVKQFKDKIAVSHPQQQLTVSQLDRTSNQLAACLKSHGVRRQDRIVICMKRSPRLLIALLGILKTDAIYVPVDPGAPTERILKIIDDSRPTVVISEPETASRIINSRKEKQFRVIYFDEEVDSANEYAIMLDSFSEEPHSYANIDSDIAYILYTSGSTGMPKGVMVTHLNVVSYINWAAEYLKIRPEDVILNTAPVQFDMSIFDIYSALKTGATLAMISDNMLLFPKKLIAFIESEGVTIWKGVSSLLMYMARTNSLKPGQMPHLKKILFAGEILPTKYLIEWMQCFPEKQFFNGYGPTEATGMSTCYPVLKIPQGPDEKIPIGKACGNTEILILKKDNSIALSGEIGELCIRGSCVALGYWNDDEKTGEKFVPNPLTQLAADRIYRTGDLSRINSEGDLEFIGRIDNQIKWMGYRIEVEEIENSIISFEEIKDAAVISQIDEVYGTPQLIAFAEIRNGVTPQNLLERLQKRLPKYMIPHKLIAIESIPRTINGKIDRKILRDSLKA